MSNQHLSLSLPKGSLKIRYRADPDVPFGDMSHFCHLDTGQLHPKLPHLTPTPILWGRNVHPCWAVEEKVPEPAKAAPIPSPSEKYAIIFMGWNSGVCAGKANISQTGFLCCKALKKEYSWLRKAGTCSSSPLLFWLGSQDYGLWSPELVGHRDQVTPGPLYPSLHFKKALRESLL